MPSIKTEITKGVFWTAVAKYSGIFIMLGVTAILARNISPSDFGTMAVATVLMSFLEIFTDMGLGPAIIQFNNITERQLSSLFMLGGFVGLMLAVGLYFLSPLVAIFYHDEILGTVIKCLSVNLIFNALNIVTNALMLKEKRFKTIAIRTLALQLVSGSAAVFAALDGWGIYALLIAPIATSIGVFIVNFINYPQRITFNIDFDVIKRIGSYSIFQFLFTCSNYFSRNIDKLIIGKYFSMTDLGYYEKSYRLMQLPMSNITFVIAPVLHPVLSSLQDNKTELGNKNVKLLTILSWISFPIGIILFFCAPEIILIVFGENWIPSIPVFKILSLSLPLQMLLSTSGAFYQAAGKTSLLFYNGLCNTIVTVIGFLIAAFIFNKLEAMAWAWDITLIINFINTYLILNKLTLAYPVVVFFRSFFAQIINSVTTFLITYLLISFISFENLIIELLIKSVIISFFTVYMAYILRQYNIISIISKLRNKVVGNPKDFTQYHS